MKVIGVGLNKTGTKTLRAYLREMGFKHHTYDLPLFKEYRKGNLEAIFTVMDEYDSFEDWPWPLMYKEIDERYKDAKFILTTRKTPETWYKSLCKMAVRMGPMSDFEKHIYGYSMPHGHKKEHIDYYNRYNMEVEEYFKGRPDKLLKICFGEGGEGKKIADFLNRPEVTLSKPHRNKSPKVYEGDHLFWAHVHRIRFQFFWHMNQRKRKLKNFVKKLIGRRA
ncbi:MAG: sulfotransferase [Bacteroidota bacterium]